MFGDWDVDELDTVITGDSMIKCQDREFSEKQAVKGLNYVTEELEWKLLENYNVTWIIAKLY